jgi:hypothetical protein
MPVLPRILIAAVLALSTGGPALAQSTGLEDLVGARAGQAEGELGRRGYRNMGGAKGDDRSYTYWWNADRRQCVTIATMDGRYASITPGPAPDCRQSAAAPGRDGDDRRDAGRRAGRDGYVAPTDLSRICRNEAAAMFDRRPSDITANAPIRQRDGYLVQGWYDRRSESKGTRFFNCRFNADGRFLGVS